MLTKASVFTAVVRSPRQGLAYRHRPRFGINGASLNRFSSDILRYLRCLGLASGTLIKKSLPNRQCALVDSPKSDANCPFKVR